MKEERRGDLDGCEVLLLAVRRWRVKDMNCTRPFSRNYTEILRGALQLISMASADFLIIHFLYSLCERSDVPSQEMS